MPTIRSLPPTKKRKLESSSKAASKIKVLEDELSLAVQQNTSLNALVDLVHVVVSESEDARDVSKGIYALYRTFVLVISGGKLGLAGDEAAKTVKAWLWTQLHAYTDFLVSLLKDEEKHLRVSALQILFSLQKHLSSSISTSTLNPQFHISHFKKIVNGLLSCPASSRNNGTSDGIIDADVLHTFYETWFSVHDDVRWFFLRESATVMNREMTMKASFDVARNLLFVLEKLNTFPTEQSELNAWWVPELGTKPPKRKRQRAEDGDEDMSTTKSGENGGEGEGEEEEDDWRKFFEDEPAESAAKGPSARLHQLTIHQSLHSLASHRAVFTRAWLGLLPRIAAVQDQDTRRALSIRILNVLHRGVLPHLTRPILVMDWIGSCVDMGGSPGLLALNGLFTLMKDYNLDYPSFYTRLYAFLTRDVLHLKHRARFFRMTELFLSSTHLPATLLASFIKRLSRLSLNAPPAAIVMIIPFTYNVLKRHPALMGMIHRDTDDSGDVGSFKDPFDASEPNPMSTNALESSLWELYSHRTHYHATVSTLSKIFSEAFTKPNYAMEDFLDHTYATLFDTEAHRKIKKEPPLSFNLETDAAVNSRIELFPSKKGASEAQEEEEAISSVSTDVVTELWGF